VDLTAEDGGQPDSAREQKQQQQPQEETTGQQQQQQQQQHLAGRVSGALVKERHCSTEFNRQRQTGGIPALADQPSPAGQQHPGTADLMEIDPQEPQPQGSGFGCSGGTASGPSPASSFRCKRRDSNSAATPVASPQTGASDQHRLGSSSRDEEGNHHPQQQLQQGADAAAEGHGHEQDQAEAAASETKNLLKDRPQLLADMQQQVLDIRAALGQELLLPCPLLGNGREEPQEGEPSLPHHPALPLQLEEVSLCALRHVCARALPVLAACTPACVETHVATAHASAMHSPAHRHPCGTPHTCVGACCHRVSLMPCWRLTRALPHRC